MRYLIKSKYIGLIIFIGIFNSYSYAQLVDSVYVGTQVSPNEVFVNLKMLSGGQLVTRIQEQLKGDTVGYHIYFTACLGPSYVFYEDTTLEVQNPNVPAQYNLMIRTYYDTNSVDSVGCGVFNAVWPIDTFYRSADSIFMSIETSELNPQLRILPNPAHHRIQLEGEASLREALEYVSFYNINGQEVKRVKHPEAIISVKDLPSGTYIVETIGKGIIDRQRLVIKE